MKKLFLILMLMVGMTICIPTYPVNTEQETEQICQIPLGKRIVDNAKNFIGTPYKWGATGPKCFDCSGFVMWLYKQEGIKLNRTSRQQYYNGTPVEKDSLKTGDIIFFARNKSPKSIYHVGLIVDGNYEDGYSFIHSTKGGVKISTLTGHYKKKFFAARRIFV